MTEIKLCECGCGNPVKPGNRFYAPGGCARRGKKNSVEHNRKIGDGNRGKIRPPELRKRISDTLTGVKFSEERRATLSIARLGNQNARKYEYIPPVEKPCECGCGLLTFNDRFVHGHNSKGKPYSPSHKLNHDKAMHSDEYRNNMAKIMLGNKNSEGFVHSEATRRKHAEAMKRTRHLFAFLPNKIEKFLLSMIQHLGFEYVGNGEFWIAGSSHNYNPDFIHRDKKIIIELFSHYWHTDKEADKVRIKTYQEQGFRTLVICDDELRKKPEEQLLRVKGIASEYET